VFGPVSPRSSLDSLNIQFCLFQGPMPRAFEHSTSSVFVDLLIEMSSCWLQTYSMLISPCFARLTCRLWLILCTMAGIGIDIPWQNCCSPYQPRVCCELDCCRCAESPRVYIARSCKIASALVLEVTTELLILENARQSPPRRSLSKKLARCLPDAVDPLLYDSLLHVLMDGSKSVAQPLSRAASAC